jgi:hypothetical protein
MKIIRKKNKQGGGGQNIEHDRAFFDTAPEDGEIELSQEVMDNAHVLGILTYEDIVEIIL